MIIISFIRIVIFLQFCKNRDFVCVFFSIDDKSGRRNKILYLVKKTTGFQIYNSLKTSESSYNIPISFHLIAPTLQTANRHNIQVKKKPLSFYTTVEETRKKRHDYQINTLPGVYQTLEFSLTYCIKKQNKWTEKPRCDNASDTPTRQ